MGRTSWLLTAQELTPVHAQLWNLAHKLISSPLQANDRQIQVVSIQIMPQPLIVERHQAEFCEEVNEPAPLELQLDLGEVEPGWESPSVQQAAQGVSKTLLVQTLVSITSLSFKLTVLDQSLGEIKHANDVATEKFFVCHFLPQPCGKLPRRKSMGGVGGGEAGQPGG